MAVTTPDRRGRGGDPLLATSTSLVKAGPTPAFVLARVSPLPDGVAAYVRYRKRNRQGETLPAWLHLDRWGSDGTDSWRVAGDR